MFQGLRHFVQGLINSLNPAWYTNISNLKERDTVKHMLLVLAFSMGVMCILFLPTVFNLSNSINEDLGMFNELRIRGSINMSAPIAIPASDSEIVLDFNTDKRKITNEKLVVTNTYVYFKPLGGALRINVKKLLNPLEYKDESASFLAMVFIWAIPALLLFLFVMFFIKYAFLIGIMYGLAYLVLKVLLLYGITARRIFNVVCYAATLMIFLEIVFIPLNGVVLLPLFQMLFLDFYLIPILIFVGYAITGLWYVEHTSPSEHKSSEWQF